MPEGRKDVIQREIRGKSIPGALESRRGVGRIVRENGAKESRAMGIIALLHHFTMQKGNNPRGQREAGDPSPGVEGATGGSATRWGSKPRS